MFDFDECLHALYFNPIAQIILDSNRHVIMMNRPAELLLGTTHQQYAGRTLDNLIHRKTKQPFTLALNQAAERTADSDWAPPIAVQVSCFYRRGTHCHHEESEELVDLDINVCAWQTTDPLFNTPSTPAFEPSAGGSNGATSAQSGPRPASKTMGGRGGPGTSPELSSDFFERDPAIIHEAYYSLVLQPRHARRAAPIHQNAHTDPRLSELVQMLTDHMDIGIFALTSDGEQIYANPACRVALGAGNLPAPDYGEGLTWLQSKIEVWDSTFTKKYSNEMLPLYRAAIQGEIVPEQLVGLDFKIEGKRKVVELCGLPVRDSSGALIGGMVRIQDAQVRNERLETQTASKVEEQFKILCDSMPQLVWTTYPDGYHDYYSKGWYDFTGSNLHDSQGVGWQGLFHSDDMPETSRRWSHSLRTGEPYSNQYRCRRHDGVWRWMLGRALPLRDVNGNIIKWLGTCTDIHDTIEALAAARQSQAQLASIINYANVTLWAIDADAKITIAEGPGVRQLKLMSPATPLTMSDRDSESMPSNPVRSEGMRSNTGRSDPKEDEKLRSMVGKSIYEIWDAPDIQSSVENALRGVEVVHEMEVEGRWFRTQFTPIREPINADDIEEGKIIGVVGASMDITEKKKADQKLQESTNERIRALTAETAAKEASRLKSEFLANMSHEIRTPIAGVIGLSELLCSTALSKEQRDYAENIQRSADALLTVINDILDFSKVEIGKLDMENAPFCLNVVIQDTRKMLTFATEKKNLEFIEDTQIDRQQWVLGDAGRLRQVLTNLLTNAIKFTAYGRITMRALVDAEDETVIRVKFVIEDTGCGISAPTMRKLFRPFSQADSSTARKFGGTGLGLTISKNLVELMMGQIGLESEENKGSKAWVIIPFNKTKNPLPEHLDPRFFGGAFSPSMTGLSEKDLLKRRTMDQHRLRRDVWILVAEDNLINQQIALKTLRKMGYNAIAASNGIEALKEVQRRPYDIILMDCQMPDMDGYEATIRIRKSVDPGVKEIPIIAMTASAIRGDREKCIEAGMSDYLSKPVKGKALESMILKWLPDDPGYNLSPAQRQSARTGSPPTTHGASNGSPGPQHFTLPSPMQKQSAVLPTAHYPTEPHAMLPSAFPPSQSSPLDALAQQHQLPPTGLGNSSQFPSSSSLKSIASDGSETTRLAQRTSALNVMSSPAIPAMHEQASSLSRHNSSHNFHAFHHHHHSLHHHPSPPSGHALGGSNSSGSGSGMGTPALPAQQRREQGGLGRDLNAEVLHAVCSTSPTVSVPSPGSVGYSGAASLQNAHTASPTIPGPSYQDEMGSKEEVDRISAESTRVREPSLKRPLSDHSGMDER